MASPPPARRHRRKARPAVGPIVRLASQDGEEQRRRAQHKKAGDGVTPEGVAQQRRRLRAQQAREAAAPWKERVEVFSRGKKAQTRNLRDVKLRGQLRRKERVFGAVAKNAARSEILLPEVEGMLEAEGAERTFRIKQDAIAEEVDLQSRTKIFNLNLDFGDYMLDFSRNGRFLALGGQKGHLSLIDTHNYKLKCEIFVEELVRDVKFLHNETMFAAAQRRHVFIYDQRGTEIHCLKQHTDVNRLDFLPYHYLLATVGNAGVLKYHDVSVGRYISEHRTKMGPCRVMQQNKFNAVMCLGHKNGVVSMWSPAMTEPLAKIFSHQGPVTSLAVDDQGRYMATGGLDGRVKMWDVRTFRVLQEYRLQQAPEALDISQRGILAMGFGTHVEMWKDCYTKRASAPYMVHRLQPGCGVRDVQFQPFEDVLGLAHVGGFSSILVPGSGEPNVDSMEMNPFENKKQRRESEVFRLLDKLQPETIGLDPNFVGSVMPKFEVQQQAKRTVAAKATTKNTRVNLKRSASEMSDHEEESEDDEENREQASLKKQKRKKKEMKKFLRKSRNVVDERKMQIRERLAKERKAREKKDGQHQEEAGPLRRFFSGSSTPRTSASKKQDRGAK